MTADLFDRDAAIVAALSKLAIARGGVADDVVLEAYVDQLADLDVDLLADACWTLGRTAREQYEAVVPPVAVIRAAVERLARAQAEEIARARLLPMPVVDDERGPRFACPTCHDEPNGWRVATCLGSGANRVAPSGYARGAGSEESCGRVLAHGPHTFAVRCDCWGRNPVVAQRRADAAERGQ